MAHDPGQKFEVGREDRGEAVTEAVPGEPIVGAVESGCVSETSRLRATFRRSGMGKRLRRRRGSRRSTGSITKGTSRLALAAERAGVKDPPSVAALVVRRWGRPSGAESPGGFPLTCTSLGITSTPRQEEPMNDS